MQSARRDERSTAERLAATGPVYKVAGQTITNAREHTNPRARDLIGEGSYYAVPFTDHCSGPFGLRNAAARTYWYDHWRRYVQDCPVEYASDATDYPKDLCALWVRLDQDLPEGMVATALHLNDTYGLADLDQYGAEFDRLRSYGGHAAPSWEVWEPVWGRSAFRLGFVGANEANPLNPSFADIPETVLDHLVLEHPLRDIWRSTWAALRNARGSTAQGETWIAYCEEAGREAYHTLVRQYPDAHMDRSTTPRTLRWLHLTGGELTGRTMHPQFRKMFDQDAGTEPAAGPGDGPRGEA